MSALERPLGALRAPTTAPLALAAPADAVARRRYYFALVVKNQIVYLAMADKSISDIEAAHRFLKDISTKYASARCRWWARIAGSPSSPARRAQVPAAVRRVGTTVRAEHGHGVQGCSPGGDGALRPTPPTSAVAAADSGGPRLAGLLLEQ